MAASAQLLTDLQTVINNTPSATSVALSNAPSGPIIDYVGNVRSALLKLQEARTQLNIVAIDTDPGTDAANLTLIQNIILALV